MIKLPVILFIFLIFTASLLTQDLDYLKSGGNYKLLAGERKFSVSTNAFLHRKPALYKKSDIPTPLYVLGIAALISPMVVFEDKKTFFALTKEISVGKFPYGRLSFEYSYVFRNYNRHHLRFSYNYDIVLEASDFVAIVATPGAGYFTDTKNKGWFLHGSGGLILAASEFITFYPYLRYRHTFINDKLKSNINDISLGTAFILFIY